MKKSQAPSDVDKFIGAFKDSWERTLVAYQERRLNGEHCLQANLYSHLIQALPQNFYVFTEAVVRSTTESSNDGGNKAKVVIDLLVARSREDFPVDPKNPKLEVIGAVELKFLPRGWPITKNVRKDLTSLSTLTHGEGNVLIEMPRFYVRAGGHGEEIEPLTLAVNSNCALIFASYCRMNRRRFTKVKFWEHHCPESGDWAGQAQMPHNLGVALGLTHDEGRVKTDFFGLL